MEHSSDTYSGLSRKLVILCISVTAAINVPTYYILTEHASEMAEIRSSLARKAADSYYRRDADAHEKFENIRYEGIIFRFIRNEAQIENSRNEIELLKAKGR
jgi:hypothetical protein